MIKTKQSLMENTILKKVAWSLLLAIAITQVFFDDITYWACKWDTVFCESESSWLTAVKENLPKNVIWSDSLTEVIMWYVGFFLPFAGLFAFVALIYAGFLYVTSAANEENAEKAKNIVIYVWIWMLLIFLSYSIVALFINLK